MAPLATIMLNQNKLNINKWYKVTLSEAIPTVLAILYLAAAAGAATARIHVNNAASALAGFYRLPALGFAGLRERNGLHEVDDLLVALTLDEGGARDFAERAAPITDVDAGGNWAAFGAPSTSLAPIVQGEKILTLPRLTP